MKAKKVLCLVLALAMVLALAACGGSPAPSASPASQDTPSSAPEPTSSAGTETPAKTEAVDGFEIPSDLPKFKIGCLGVFSGSELYIQWKNNLLSLEDKFNVEFQFLDQGGDSATDVENMCIAGVNGILMQGCSESILQITEKYNVPFAAYCMQFSDEEMATFAQYKTFLGVVTEDDVIGAMDAADAMYNAGCRNVAVAGLTRGYALSQDNRCDAFMHRFTELGGNIIAEDYSLMMFADSISSFAAAYPELDGVFTGFLNEGVFQAFTTEGLVGKAKLASFDFTEACVDFLNNGTMVYTASGQQGTIMAAFAMLYNYLYDGTYIIQDRSQMLVRNWICVYNGQDATDFNEYIRFSSIYSPDEIAQMIVGFNPDYSPEKFKEAQTAYSIADVKARSNA